MFVLRMQNPSSNVPKSNCLRGMPDYNHISAFPSFQTLPLNFSLLPTLLYITFRATLVAALLFVILLRW